MAMLYQHPCNSEVCYNEVELYLVENPNDRHFAKELIFRVPVRIPDM